MKHLLSWTRFLVVSIGMSLLVSTVVYAENIDGPWLIDNVLIDERGNKSTDQAVVFFEETESALSQNSTATDRGGDAELATYSRMEGSSFNLTAPLSIVAYADDRMFDALTLQFDANRVALNGAVNIGDRNYSYEGSGRFLSAVEIDAENGSTVSNLKNSSDALPLLFKIIVPENTKGLKVSTVDTTDPGTRAHGGDVKLHLVKGTTILPSRKSNFINNFEREVGASNPDAGIWYIMLDTDIQFDRVDLVVEMGDGVDIPDPVDPVNPTNPTTPTKPTNPLDPSNPTDPSDGSDVSDFTNPTAPLNQSDPTDPSDPTDATDPQVPVELVKPHVGWWWNSAEGGSGFSIEFQEGKDAANKNALFFGAYLYNDAGTAVWHTALLEPVENRGNEYEGNLLDFRNGSTLESNRYTQPRLIGTAGRVRIKVIDEDHLKLEWAGGNYTIESFSFATNADQQDIESGWWWNPFTPGQGFFMEQQGDVIYFVSYLYNERGDAVWYAAWLTNTDSVRKGSLEYNGRLISYTGGQTLEGDYIAPQSPTDIGQVSIVFQTENLATINWPGGRQSIQRFYFRN